MTHASVFSGIGGPEVAATMLGWENLFHCEINPFGRAVLDYWYPNAKSYDDITKTDFSEWRGKIDVLTGGFPCQPFSYAGQRRGAEDDRYLWPYMFKCIDAIRPTWVVAENVGGILTMVEQGEVSEVGVQGSLFGEEDAVRRYELRETFTLERICDDLETHGYAVQPVLVPACAVGAPHRRDRVFIVGRRRDDERNGDTAERKASDTANAESAGGRCLCEHPRSEQPNGTTERMPSDTDRPCGLDAPTDTPCGGEGAPGEGGSVEGDGSHQDKQPCQRGAATEWNSRFYELLRNAADTDNNGLQHDTKRGKQASVFGAESSGRQNGISEQIQRLAATGSGRDASDTDSDRGREMDEHLQSRQPNGAEPFGNGGERDAADTDSLRLHAGNGGDTQGHGRAADGQPETHDGGLASTIRREWETAESCGDRWRQFPTVSPVHRGNDGLPFPLDDLTLSPAKWRTEALKAYGNAIVPQVMYEIFRAIEMAEKSPNQLRRVD